MRLRTIIRSAPWQIAIAALMFGALPAAPLLAAPPAAVTSTSDAVELVPHRAVYDMKLLRTRGTRAVEGIRGRIVYDFSGSSCEGYALSVRQVSELDAGEGKNSITDLRATTFEDGRARNFRFMSQNRMDQQAAESIDGTAERKPQAVAVNLRKPKTRTFRIDSQTVFPTEHMRRIIEGARAGRRLLEVPVFDGSETGDKVFNTLTVIGEMRPASDKPADDATAGNTELSGLRRWPVTVSYFDRSRTDRSSEQMPSYTIAFELFENGISRALVLDYGDFAISGSMASLDIGKSKPCP